MSAFPSYVLGDRQRVRVNGRGLFFTDSAFIQFVRYDGREAFPVSPEPQDGIQPAGSGYVLPFEVDGWFIIARDARFSLHEAAPYERFDLNPAFLVQTRTTVPFVSKLVDVQYEAGLVTIYYPNNTLKSLALSATLYYTSDDAGTRETITLYANAPFDISRFVVDVPYKGADGYGALSSTAPNPAPDFPSYIVDSQPNQRNNDGSIKTWRVDYNDVALQTQSVQFSLPPGGASESNLRGSVFAPGSFYRGATGYPGYTKI